MRTRHATEADVPTLRAMLQALSDESGGSDVASEMSLAEHGFGQRALFHAQIAEESGSALGMAIYYPDYSTHRGEPGLYVQDVYVVPEARGRGIGRTLLGAAMRAQDWGARYMTLSVGPENAEATRFYAREGFRPRGYDFLIADGEALARLTLA